MSMSLRPAAWLLSAFLSFVLAACHNGGPEQNAAPAASAGADLSVSPGSAVALDGTGSVDHDGHIASYQWRQISPASPQVGVATRSASPFGDNPASDQPRSTRPAAVLPVLEPSVARHPAHSATPCSVVAAIDSHRCGVRSVTSSATAPTPVAEPA